MLMNCLIVVEVIGEPLLHRGFLGEVLISLLDVVLVGLTTCGRLVLGQGAKVLSGSAQGICPPHPGRWSWLAEGRTRWSERTWGIRRNEWNCRRDQEQRSHNAHETWDVMEWVRTPTWAMRVHVIHCENWTVCCSRPLSAVNDLTATNLRKILKVDTSEVLWKDGTHNGSPNSIMALFACMLNCGHSCWLTWAQPGLAPLPPAGGRTRLLSFSRFLVKTAWCGQRIVESPIFHFFREIHQFFLYWKNSCCVIR